jgi:hypothetical protein
LQTQLKAIVAMEIRFTATLVEGPMSALAVALVHHGRDHPTSFDRN